MSAKFEIGQKVRPVNEMEPKTVVGIVFNGGYHYDIEHYNGNRVHRISEGDLVKYKK